MPDVMTTTKQTPKEAAPACTTCRLALVPMPTGQLGCAYCATADTRALGKELLANDEAKRPSARRARPQPAPERVIEICSDGSRHELVDARDGECIVTLVGCDTLTAHRIASVLEGAHGELVVGARRLLQTVEALDQTYPDEGACDRAWERLDTAAGDLRRVLRRVR